MINSPKYTTQCSIHFEKELKFYCKCNSTLCIQCINDHHHENIVVKPIKYLKQEFFTEKKSLEKKLANQKLMKFPEIRELKHLKKQLDELEKESYEDHTNINFFNEKLILFLNKNECQIVNDLIIENMKKFLMKIENSYEDKIEEESKKSEHYQKSMNNEKGEKNEKNSFFTEEKISESKSVIENSKTTSISNLDSNKENVNFLNLPLAFNAFNFTSGKSSTREIFKEIALIDSNSKESSSKDSNYFSQNNLNLNASSKKEKEANIQKKFKNKKENFVNFNYHNYNNFNELALFQDETCTNKDSNSETMKIVCITCREVTSIFKEQAMWKRRCDVCSFNLINNNKNY